MGWPDLGRRSLARCCHLSAGTIGRVYIKEVQRLVVIARDLGAWTVSRPSCRPSSVDRPSDTESEVIETRRRVCSSANTRAAAPGGVCPAPAANDAVGAVHANVVQVPTPLPHTPKSVEESPSARSLGGDHVSPPVGIACKPGNGIERAVVRPSGASATCELPLGLGRQAIPVGSAGPDACPMTAFQRSTVTTEGEISKGSTVTLHSVPVRRSTMLTSSVPSGGTRTEEPDTQEILSPRSGFRSVSADGTGFKKGQQAPSRSFAPWDRSDPVPPLEGAMYQVAHFTTQNHRHRLQAAATLRPFQGRPIMTLAVSDCAGDVALLPGAS